MSGWHYQVMKHGEDWYEIHEYYPTSDGPLWTESGSTVSGESVEEIRQALTLMLNDTYKHGVKDYDEGLE